jgi:hypothetical protein
MALPSAIFYFERVLVLPVGGGRALETHQFLKTFLHDFSPEFV